MSLESYMMSSSIHLNHRILLSPLVLCFLRIAINPPPFRKEANLVLQRIDDIAENEEDEEEDDYYDCYGNVFADHIGGGEMRRARLVMWCEAG